MTTSIRHDLVYAASPDQVHAMLADQAFRERVCEFQRYTRHDVTISGGTDRMSVRIDQYRPATEVPGFARKFVGEEINILQEEEWRSPTSADLSVSMPGRPGEMRGSITVAGTDGETTETVAVDVTVRIPLVGGRIEGLIAEMLVRALKAEHRVGQEWLAERS